MVAALLVVYELRSRAEARLSVSPQDLIRLLSQGALLLDLRPAEQFRLGHVAGARQMDGAQILNAADTLKKYKEKPVVVYDDTGSLTGAAVRQLNGQGFTQAVALRGGLTAWRAENLPLVR